MTWQVDVKLHMHIHHQGMSLSRLWLMYCTPALQAPRIPLVVESPRLQHQYYPTIRMLLWNVYIACTQVWSFQTCSFNFDLHFGHVFRFPSCKTSNHDACGAALQRQSWMRVVSIWRPPSRSWLTPGKWRRITAPWGSKGPENTCRRQSTRYTFGPAKGESLT